MDPPVTSAKKRAEEPAHKADQDRAPKGAPETLDMEAQHNVIHEQEHEAVHDKNKKPERENDERRGKQEKDGPEECVEDSKQERRANQRARTVVANAVNEPGRNDHRNCCDRPAKKKMPHAALGQRRVVLRSISACAPFLCAYRLADIRKK